MKVTSSLCSLFGISMNKGSVLQIVSMMEKQPYAWHPHLSSILSKQQKFSTVLVHHPGVHTTTQYHVHDDTRNLNGKCVLKCWRYNYFQFITVDLVGQLIVCRRQLHSALNSAPSRNWLRRCRLFMERLFSKWNCFGEIRNTFAIQT